MRKKRTDIPAEAIEIVTEALGRAPKRHEVGPELSRIIRTARAATTNADRARVALNDMMRGMAKPTEGIEQERRKLAARMGVHYHGDILRRDGTLEDAIVGLPVRLDDTLVRRSAFFDNMTGIVGTPMLGGVPGVERNSDMYPYLARGLSYDAGEFYAFYRSDSIIRESVADIIGVIAGATIEVKALPTLSERNAEILGVDRDEQDRIADIVNAELQCGAWGNLSMLIQEALRIAIINGANVHEFMLDPIAPVGRRIVGISPRLPNTWMRWIQDPITGEAVALQQTNPNGGTVGAGLQTIDLSRCIHIAIDQDGDNFEGLSLLRSARAWDVLSFEVNSATILHWQRFGPGVPVIRDKGIGNSSSKSSAAAYEALAKYANLSSAVLQLGADVDVELLQMQSNTGFAEIIELCTRMKRAAMRNSLAGLGAESSGAYNLGDIKSQLWLKGLRVFASQIESGFNRLIRAYVDTYIGQQVVYPTLSITGFAARSPVEVIEVQTKFAQLVSMGVHTDVELDKIAEKAEVVWNGRGEEANSSDPELAENDQGPDNEPQGAEVDETPALEVDTTEPRSTEGSVPPSAAAQSAALGRRTRARSENKWQGSISDLALSKAITEQRPLTRIQLRELEAYFSEAAQNAPFDERSPEWQEWQCMGGDAMAEWVLAELNDEAGGDVQRVAKRYDHIDFTPPKGVRDAAKRALEVRESKPPSERGMTPVGIARARDLANGRTVSPETARRMLAYFERHEVDKQGKTWPEQGKGWQAWQGWGGDAGFAWSRKLVRQMEAADNETRSVDHSVCDSPDCGCHDGLTARRASEKTSVTVETRGGGSFVTWRSLRPEEANVAWDEIKAQKTLATDRILNALSREQRRHRDAFAERVNNQTAVELADMSVDWSGNYEAALVPALRQFSRFAANDMLDEIESALGGKWKRSTQPIEGSADEQAAASAKLLAQVMNDRTNETLRGAAVQVANGAPRSTLTRADVGVGYAAKGLIVQTLSTTTNAVRNRVSATQGPRITKVIYSAVMDRMTCEACAEADGTVLQYGSADYNRLMPPNARCHSVQNSRGSENQCQCVYVYEFEADNENAATTDDTRRAVSQPVVRLYVGPPGAGKSSLASTSGLEVIDRDSFVLTGDRYERAGVKDSLTALAESIGAIPVAYVTCALSASSRAALRSEIESMGARVECVEVSASREWLRLVNEERQDQGRQIPWDQWEHLIDAWEPVADNEFDSVERVVTD